MNNQEKKEGVTKIDDLPSNENIKLEVNDSKDSINMNDIFKEVQDVGKNGNLNLPTKDIPMNQSNVTMDEKGFTNYIPKNDNYIDKMYEPMEEIKENQRKKENKIDSLEAIYDELQTPILMSVLYFVFQLPIVNDMLNKYLKFIFRSDGNLNIYGYIFKSLLYSSSFYLFNKVLDYISD